MMGLGERSCLSMPSSRSFGVSVYGGKSSPSWSELHHQRHPFRSFAQALNIVMRIPAAVRSSETQLVPRLPISSTKHGLPPRSR